MALVRIITPTLNRLDLLQNMVLGLRASVQEPHELIVVDNGGRAWRWCAEEGIRCLRTGRKLGFAEANNWAAKQAGDWTHLLLLNDDIQPWPGFLRAMLEVASTGCAIVGAVLFYGDGVTIQHAGVHFSVDGAPFHAYKNQGPNIPWLQNNRIVPAVTFACTLIERELWMALGGLDERYKNGYEDVDMCLRARERGAIIGMAMQARLVHHESQSAGRSTTDMANWAVFKETWHTNARLWHVLGVAPHLNVGIGKEPSRTGAVGR